MYSLVMNKTYSVNWTVGAGKTLTGATKIFMSEGDTVTFNMSYTPTDASVKIGLLTPKNTFLNYTRNNGSLSTTLSVIYLGVHQFRVQNTSDEDITITGTYTVSASSPFEYMFKSPYMATYLSSLYGEYRGNGDYHYAIDITTGTPGEIEGYPVYNTLSGEVIKNELFSDNVTTCVAIDHGNGYTSRFLHMYIDDNGLQCGDIVNTGEKIGTVSDEGSPGAYHLHYDINTIGAYAGTYLDEDNTIYPTLVFHGISFTS